MLLAEGCVQTAEKRDSGERSSAILESGGLESQAKLLNRKCF